MHSPVTTLEDDDGAFALGVVAAPGGGDVTEGTVRGVTVIWPRAIMAASRGRSASSIGTEPNPLPLIRSALCKRCPLSVISEPPTPPTWTQSRILR